MTRMSSIETHRFAFTFPTIRREAGGAPLLTWDDGVRPFDAEHHRRDEDRAGRVGWIGPEAGTAWLYLKLAVLFSEVNAFYDFELLGLLDPLQFTVYGAGNHFDWHIDVGGGAAPGGARYAVRSA